MMKNNGFHTKLKNTKNMKNTSLGGERKTWHEHSSAFWVLLRGTLWAKTWTGCALLHQQSCKYKATGKYGPLAPPPISLCWRPPDWWIRGKLLPGFLSSYDFTVTENTDTASRGGFWVSQTAATKQTHWIQWGLAGAGEYGQGRQVTFKWWTSFFLEHFTPLSLVKGQGPSHGC